MTEQLKQLIRDIPDFPKPGILFKDLTPLLRDPSGFGRAVDLLASRDVGKKIDVVRHARGDETQHLALALGQVLERRRRLPFGRGAAGELADQPVA